MKWLKDLFRKNLTIHTSVYFMQDGDALRRVSWEKFLQEMLNRRLTEAVENEDYEEAARIRDLINRK